MCKFFTQNSWRENRIKITVFIQAAPDKKQRDISLVPIFLSRFFGNGEFILNINMIDQLKNKLLLFGSSTHRDVPKVQEILYIFSHDPKIVAIQVIFSNKFNLNNPVPRF